MGYYNCWDPIYRIGTREFRKRCCINTNKAISLQKDMDAVDEALKDKGISTEGFTPEDYKNAIDELSAEQYYGIEFDITNPSPIMYKNRRYAAAFHSSCSLEDERLFACR